MQEHEMKESVGRKADSIHSNPWLLTFLSTPQHRAFFLPVRLDIQTQQEEAERGLGDGHADNGEALADAFEQGCFDGELQVANLIQRLSKSIVARYCREDGEYEEEHEGHNVDVVADAVRSQADDASVEPKHEEKEDQRSQHLHDARGLGGLAAERHLGVKRAASESRMEW